MGQTAKLGKKESERAQHRLMKRRKKREIKNRKTETASEKRELRRRGEREKRGHVCLKTQHFWGFSQLMVTLSILI